MATTVTPTLTWTECVTLVSRLHMLHSNRRINLRGGDNPSDSERLFNAGQLAMADEEESIQRKLMQAHVDNGGDLSDFARL